MTIIDPVFPSVFNQAADFIRSTLRIFIKRTEDVDTVEDSRMRREFVQEMLHRNPDAFSSDLDVQSMMQHYPGIY